MQDSNNYTQNNTPTADFTAETDKNATIERLSAKRGNSDSQINIFHSLDAFFNSPSANVPKTASNGLAKSFVKNDNEATPLRITNELQGEKNSTGASRATLNRENGEIIAEDVISTAPLSNEVIMTEDKQIGHHKLVGEEDSARTHSSQNEQSSSVPSTFEAQRTFGEETDRPKDRQDSAQVIKVAKKHRHSVGSNSERCSSLINGNTEKRRGSVNSSNDNLGGIPEDFKEPREAFMGANVGDSVSMLDTGKNSAKTALNCATVQTHNIIIEGENGPAVNLHSGITETSACASEKTCAKRTKIDAIVKNCQRHNSEGVAREPKEIISVPISSITPNPNQPRKHFDEPSILKLADSISQFGIIQPLTVRKEGQAYELVAGERRLRAATELGWTSVPCVVANVDEVQSAQISIIENLLRENLNIFEQAQAIEALIDTYGLTQEQVAANLSNSQSYVANKLRLLRFSPSERQLIVENKLTERHARAILRINDPKTRQIVIEKAIRDALNVAETESLVQGYLTKLGGCDENNTRNRRIFKDTSAFFATISRALDAAKASNIGIKSRKIVGESFTEITIILPNSAGADEN